MRCYAQLTPLGIVKAVTEHSSGELSGENIIPIPSLDGTLLGKKYAGGKFIDAQASSVFSESCAAASLGG